MLDDTLDQPSPPAAPPTADPLKKRRLVGLLLAASGLLGHLVIYILSRIIAVTVSVPYHSDQMQWWSWQNDVTVHSWKYFIQVYDLELLAILFSFLLIGGISLFLVSWPPFRAKFFD